jgi:lysophospholipase L1-like esterase
MRYMSRHNRYIAILSFMVCVLCLNANAADKEAHWVGAWAAAPRNLPVPAADQAMADMTYRDVVHITMGGHAFRLRLTNEFGTAPLKIGGVHIAIGAGNGAIQPGTDKPVMFGGEASTVIPDGAFVLSDPVEMDAKAFTNLAISIFVPAQTIKVMTVHPLGNATTYIAAGNGLSDAKLTNAKTALSWYLLKGVETLADEHSASIVTLGDSITDGRSSTVDANGRWPDVLATRLQSDKSLAGLSVLNEGISGNRILHDFDGPSALSRFDRDVVAQSGCKYLIVLEGINDIGQTAVPKFPNQEVTAKDIILGLEQLLARAHEHGIKVFVGTIIPYEGAAYYSADGDRDRQTVNSWIRASGIFDGVIDFDKTVRDPSHPTKILPMYDDGHHLHPNDAGYRAMANAINLQIFH